MVQNFGRKSRREGTTWETSARWEDNIKVDVIETGFENMNQICLTQDRSQCQFLVNMVRAFGFHEKSGIF
jgi:hypothetical protein